MQIKDHNYAKIFLIYLALIIISITLLGCASRQTEITIPASPDKIWTVLTDTDGYKEWNPVFVPLKGRLEQVEEGEFLTWSYTQPGQAIRYIRKHCQIRKKSIRLENNTKISCRWR